MFSKSHETCELDKCSFNKLSCSSPFFSFHHLPPLSSSSSSSLVVWQEGPCYPAQRISASHQVNPASVVIQGRCAGDCPPRFIFLFCLMPLQLFVSFAARRQWKHKQTHDKFQTLIEGRVKPRNQQQQRPGEKTTTTKKTHCNEEGVSDIIHQCVFSLFQCPLQCRHSFPLRCLDFPFGKISPPTRMSQQVPLVLLSLDSVAKH